MAPQAYCLLCRRPIGVEGDPLSNDCGGDCWGCCREIETGTADPRPPAHRLAKGDRVMLTCEGRTVEAFVLIASPNGRSLILTFEAILDGHVGTLPTFQDDNGVHRTLMNGTPVSFERDTV